MTANLELEEWIEADEFEDDEGMSTLEHGLLCNTIGTEIKVYLKTHPIGRVFGSSSEYRFLQSEPLNEGQKGRKRKPAKQPDVSFVRNENLPKRFRSYPDIVPDLAVEVASPTDRQYEIEAKADRYQKAGVKLVWLVHPFSQRVDVYRLATALLPEPLGINGELDGENVLPGFKLKVSDIFDYPFDPDPEPDRPV